MVFHLTREADFLRELLRLSPDPAHLRKLAAHSNWFDWDLFEELLFCSRVAPLIANRIGGIEEASRIVPKPLVDRILVEGETAAVRSILKENEFVEVVSALNDSSIPSIVLKGLPFAERYYGDASLRDVRDLDLLVMPEQLYRAEKLLKKHGYEIFEGIHSRSYYKRHHFHVVYIRRDKRVDVVELHWNLLPPPRSLSVDVSSLFRSSVSSVFRDVPILTLSALDNITYFCASLRMSQFTSLKRLVDLNHLLNREGESVSHEQLAARGKVWGLTHEMRIAFLLLDRFWGTEKVVDYPGKVRCFASRVRGTDFFGIRPGREIRLRIWAGFHLDQRKPLTFMLRLLFPDEAFRAEMYYSEEQQVSFFNRVRRVFAGLFSLVDLVFHLAFSRIRSIR